MAGATKALVEFDLSGNGGGKWWVKVHDGTAESGKGELTADAGDWVRIMTGQLDSRAAYMQGKLKIKGDAGLAMKFQTLFKTPS